MENKNEPSEQVLLKEYELQVNVAIDSWRRRYTLVGLNMAAVGTLVGLYLNIKNPIMLLILSLISAALGIVWAGENFWVVRNKKYMNKLSDKLGLDDKWLNDIPINNLWDTFKNMVKGKLPGAVIGVFLFFAPSVLSCVFASVESIQKRNFCKDGFYIIFIFNILLIILLIMSGIAWYLEYRKIREEKISRPINHLKS